MDTLYRRLYLLLTDAKADEEELLEGREPGNFVKLLIARTGSSIGDRLASSKTTLAWLLQNLGAPVFFIGAIVPLRESGALLPQLFLSGLLKRFALRKWAWSLGAIVQGAAIAGCALVAVSLEGAVAGAAILALVALFSLARGLSSIAAKDVLGKTIRKSKRGQLTGWASSLSGVLAILSTGFLFFSETGEGSRLQYVVFLLAAAFAWWIAAAVHLRVEEKAERGKQTAGAWGELKRQLGLLKSDAAFRDFLIVRAMAVGSGLSAPYIVSLAYERLGGNAGWLGAFIVAEGAAATLASPLWGRWADRSSKAVLRASMLGASLLLVSTIGYTLAFEGGGGAVFVFPFILFLLGAIHAGVRVGRKTYLVDMAEGDKRTDHVAVGNSLIGVLLLVVGAATGLLALAGTEVALGAFAGMGLLGAWYGGRLRSTS